MVVVRVLEEIVSRTLSSGRLGTNAEPRNITWPRLYGSNSNLDPSRRVGGAAD